MRRRVLFVKVSRLGEEKNEKENVHWGGRREKEGREG